VADVPQPGRSRQPEGPSVALTAERAKTRLGQRAPKGLVCNDQPRHRPEHDRVGDGVFVDHVERLSYYLFQNPGSSFHTGLIGHVRAVLSVSRAN
jgi:hypothetical protein